VKRSTWWWKGRQQKHFYNIRFMRKTMIIIILSSQLIFCHSTLLLLRPPTLQLKFSLFIFHRPDTFWSRVSNLQVELSFRTFWLGTTEGFLPHSSIEIFLLCARTSFYRNQSWRSAAFLGGRMKKKLLVGIHFVVHFVESCWTFLISIAAFFTQSLVDRTIN
jgi:hypothetical protein